MLSIRPTVSWTSSARLPSQCDRQWLGKQGGVIPAAVAPSPEADNCLLIGDAAGMVNPMTGGGYRLTGISLSPVAFLIYEWLMHLAIRTGIGFLGVERKEAATA